MRPTVATPTTPTDDSKCAKSTKRRRRQRKRPAECTTAADAPKTAENPALISAHAAPPAIPPAATTKSKPIYEHGNYASYYGYRYAEHGHEDPRLAALEPSWFRGCDCLDIGCNSGHLTLALARRFAVRSMLGVDIDASLVDKAREYLQQQEEQPPPPQPTTSASTSASASTQAGAALSNDDFRRLFLPSAAAQPRPPAVRFEVSNFVAEPPAPPPAQQPGVGGALGQFDAVLCLSTSKWMHLNFGDEGVTRLFKRAHACLRVGGRFFLEPQPWSSYRKRATLTPTIQKHFGEIRLRPTHFRDYLLSEAVGFRRAETVDVPYADGAAAGFKRRPLLVFVK